MNPYKKDCIVLSKWISISLDHYVCKQNISTQYRNGMSTNWSIPFSFQLQFLSMNQSNPKIQNQCSVVFLLKNIREKCRQDCTRLCRKRESCNTKNHAKTSKLKISIPSLNPFLNLLETVPRNRILPVPVCFLLNALGFQLSVGTSITRNIKSKK